MIQDSDIRSLGKAGRYLLSLVCANCPKGSCFVRKEEGQCELGLSAAAQVDKLHRSVTNSRTEEIAKYVEMSTVMSVHLGADRDDLLKSMIDLHNRGKADPLIKVMEQLWQQKVAEM